MYCNIFIFDKAKGMVIQLRIVSTAWFVAFYDRLGLRITLFYKEISTSGQIKPAIFRIFSSVRSNNFYIYCAILRNYSLVG